MNDYRNILKIELIRRQRNNPGYSQGAFARDLGLKTPQLNEILNSKRGLSETVAREVAKRMNLEGNYYNLFCNLVKYQHARSKVARDQAYEDLLKLQNNSGDFSCEFYNMVSDGIHYAILELTKLTSFKSDVKWIARVLEESVSTVEDAIKRLIKLKELEVKDGKYVACESCTVGPDEISNQSIKNHHKMNLHKAIKAIDAQDLEHRDFNAVTLAMAKEMIPEAKKEIRKFMSNFTSKFGDSALSKDEVYNISIQLFKLSNT